MFRVEGVEEQRIKAGGAAVHTQGEVTAKSVAKPCLGT